MSRRAFAVGAHPDDIEFGMAGTMLLLKRAGYELHFMNIASGNCGTTVHDPATIRRIRRKESANSARLAGAVYHGSLTDDIDIFYERGLLARIASVMRDVRPEILLVPSLEDYMEDHMSTARLAVSAAFCRGMRNFPVIPPRKPSSQPVTVYHAQPHGNRDRMRRLCRPEIYVNVTGVIGEKADLLSEHRSQKEWLDASQGLNAYIQAMKDLCGEVGKMSGRFKFAEGWRRHNPLGFCVDTADPLRDALGKCFLADRKYARSLDND